MGAKQGKHPAHGRSVSFVITIKKILEEIIKKKLCYNKPRGEQSSE